MIAQIADWSIWSYIYVGVMVVIFLGLSIFVHELGHFLAARLCGMVIDTFSLGFGPALWKRKVRETTYKIGIVPLGGYVALPQLDPSGMDKIQGKNGDAADSKDKERNLPPVSPWKRLFVILSGPAGNLILAFIITWLVYWIGIPTSLRPDKAVVGSVDETSEIYALGVRTDDAIKAIDGKPVKSWEDFVTRVALCDEVVLTTVTPAGVTNSFKIKTSRGKYGMRVIAGIEGKELCRIGAVERGSEAEKAGLRGGDIVSKVDGLNVTDLDHFVAMISNRCDMVATLTVRRSMEILELPVTPRFDKRVGRAMIGVELTTIIHPEPWSEFKKHSTLIFRLLKGLVTPSKAHNAAKAVGGPLAILDVYARLSGSLMLVIWFTGILNINLAIINLLPIPVLDGGHMMFIGWEIVARKPPSPKVVGGLVNVFAVLLIALFLLITFRDIVVRIPEDSKAGRAIDRLEQAVGMGEKDAAPAPVDTNAVDAATNMPAQALP